LFPIRWHRWLLFSAISPIIGNGKIATPLTLDVAALLPQLHNNVIVHTDGTTITGSGTTANPLVAVPQTPVVVTSSPIVGNGTLANPIDINITSAIAEISAAGGVPVVQQYFADWQWHYCFAACR
jgi:hypothetical protein